MDRAKKIHPSAFRVADDPWEVHFLQIDREHAGVVSVGANGNGTEDNNNGGDGGDDDDERKEEEGERKRKREKDPTRQRRQVRPRLERTLEETDELSQQADLITTELERVPAELWAEILLGIFLPQSKDFPGFSQPKERTEGRVPRGWWSTTPRSGTRDRRRRTWSWPRISDAIRMFLLLSDRSRTTDSRIPDLLLSAWFARQLWRQWLDGPGADPTASGRCTLAALHPSLMDTDASLPAEWYTRGFLGSVVMHRALLNSARNVVNTRDLVIRIENYLVRNTGMADSEINSYRIDMRTPDWIRDWMAGKVHTPKHWNQISYEPRWNAAWFAPQLAHGFLYLDFVRPDWADRPIAQRTRFVDPRGAQLITMMREEALRKDRQVPMVIRMPAVVLGKVLASGRQLIWGIGGVGSLSWVRIPYRDDLRPSATANLFGHAPLVVAGGLVFAGVAARGPQNPPLIGLALPDEGDGTETRLPLGDEPNLAPLRRRPTDRDGAMETEGYRYGEEQDQDGDDDDVSSGTLDLMEIMGLGGVGGAAMDDDDDDEDQEEDEEETTVLIPPLAPPPLPALPTSPDQPRRSRQLTIPEMMPELGIRPRDRQEEQGDDDDEDQEGSSSSDVSLLMLQADETLEAGDTSLDQYLGEHWYGHLMDLWMADIRVDTPMALLMLLARIGSRQTAAIDLWRRNAWLTYPRELSDQTVEDALTRRIGRLRMAGFDGNYNSVSEPYEDQKNMIMARCWLAEPDDDWLRGRQVYPSFYDLERQVWVMDVGDSTVHVHTLMLLRCMHGPALPTIVPDLRMSYLYYAVPIYRIRTGQRAGQEDLDRIKKHGRIDRLLILPRVHMAFDRVAFSPETFTNAEHWAKGEVIQLDEGDPDLFEYDPNFGWLVGPEDRAESTPLPERMLSYNWSDLESMKENWEILQRYTWRDVQRIFSVPGETSSRVNMLAVVSLLSTLDVHRRRNNPLDLFQWTNCLFAGGTYRRITDSDRVNPLGDMLRAIDVASRVGFSVKYTWLTIHPTLRQPDYINLGARVDWSAVSLFLFRPNFSRQISLRLGATLLPARTSEQDPLALFDRLRQAPMVEAIRRAYRIGRPTILVDFSDNAIPYSKQLVATIAAMNDAYLRGPVSGIAVMIGGNPATLLPDRFPYLGVFRIQDLTELAASVRARSSEQSTLGNEGEADATYAQRVTSIRQRRFLLSFYRGYRLSIDVNDTVPFGKLVVKNRPGPDTNPYGDNWQ